MRYVIFSQTILKKKDLLQKLMTNQSLTCKFCVFYNLQVSSFFDSPWVYL